MILLLNQYVGLVTVLMFKYSIVLPSGTPSPIFIDKKSEGGKYFV